MRPGGRKHVVEYSGFVGDEYVGRRGGGGDGSSQARATAGAALAEHTQVALDAAGVHSTYTIYNASLLLLGGRKFWSSGVHSPVDVHAAAVKGVPYGSLIFFVTNTKGLGEGDMAKVLGISTRTLRRQSETPDKPMPADLASKTWQVAETLAQATEVFGSREAAENWMSSPAVALNGQRPIDLMQTVQGSGVVSDYLERLEYGVYS